MGNVGQYQYAALSAIAFGGYFSPFLVTKIKGFTRLIFWSLRDVTCITRGMLPPWKKHSPVYTIPGSKALLANPKSPPIKAACHRQMASYDVSSPFFYRVRVRVRVR